MEETKTLCDICKTTIYGLKWYEHNTKHKKFGSIRVEYFTKQSYWKEFDICSKKCLLTLIEQCTVRSK